MAERGILFSDVMVRAIHAGIKTQTRRLALDRSGRPSLWTRLKPGDRLWVREVWAPEAGGGFLYRATGDQALRWRSSIHMPKRAARVWLTVTDVRVEALHAIDTADAGAEGMAIHARPCTPDSSLFEGQWNTLHGDGAWQKNPDVVVISFRVDP